MTINSVRCGVIMNLSKKSNIGLMVKNFCTSKSYLNDKTYINVVIDKKASDTFINPDVQKILKALTGLNLDKVFRARALGQQLSPSIYKFMTTEQVQQAAKDALRRAKTQLQMPPLVPIQEDMVEILEERPQLIGYDNTKHVFTDISYGIKEKDRVIVVREPNGVLRKAFGSERHRMNQIYFPRVGRMLRHPKMFQKEYLEMLWEKSEFEFILDRACCQFEPDDAQFHNVTFETYKKINEQMEFDKLRSTRHYGTLCFYLALIKNIDNLLLENLQSERLDDAVTAIQLYNIVNPDAKSASINLDPNNKLEFVKEFVKLESKSTNKLQLALQSFVDVSRIDQQQEAASS